MAGLKSVPSTALTSNDTTSQEELGQVRIESDGKEYRYVRLLLTTAVKGNIVKFTNSNNYTGTISTAAAFKNAFAGVALGTISKNRYGWVQRAGYNTFLHTDGNVVRGDALVVHSSTTSVSRRVSTTVGLIPFGRAGATDSGSICTVVYLGTH